MGEAQAHEEALGGGGAALAGTRAGTVVAGARDPVEVRVRFFAGAAAAAGLDEEVVLLEGGSATLSGLLLHLHDLHPRLGAVLEVASTLVDEVAVRADPLEEGPPLRDGAQVDVLPPFAGG